MNCRELVFLMSKLYLSFGFKEVNHLKILDKEVTDVYLLTANIRELMSKHEKEGNVQLTIIESENYGYKEVKTLENLISTHIFWLNEALHELKDELALLVNPVHKPAPQSYCFSFKYRS
ncbi:hypothetical protein D3C81_809360 [compost metagenome]